MTDVISVKFKNRGKCYFFDPNGLEINSGDKVIVETSKGLEIADCCYGNHAVSDTAVVQPLRPVIRTATPDDLRIAESNKQREKEAFDICQNKIEEHGLDMKLVDVECNFDGSKTMFFFTSDGRVDFRELVKDLAGIFRNRIELRQIGVRDEAKMLGGIGICGRPYCCNQFLDDFQPVSTKMAKVQSLSLNPTKISGSCGRLMCCLRYEQEAYEELIKKVPKQGAFVETKDGYGNVVQVNLLRQTVKVKLDGDDDDNIKSFKSNELAAVPGGRPKDGEPLPSVLNYVPEEDEPEEVESKWMIPELFAPAVEPEEPAPDDEQQVRKKSANRHHRGRSRSGSKSTAAKKPEESAQSESSAPKSRPKSHHGSDTAHADKAEARPKPQRGGDAGRPDRAEAKPKQKRGGENGRADKAEAGPKHSGENGHPDKAEAKSKAQRGGEKKPSGSGHGKTTVKPVKVEAKPHTEGAPSAPAVPTDTAAAKSKPVHRRRYYHGKPKPKSGANTKNPTPNK